MIYDWSCSACGTHFNGKYIVFFNLHAINNAPSPCPLCEIHGAEVAVRLAKEKLATLRKNLYSHGRPA